mmetsp:Transcript_5450/g.7365  ORF Transcript_5450/g.7365 Transcript_5450/m.7365 type:complete len:155 (-) Transcript_5450:155-619(-)|eukprot:CAMPEP_0196573338 /NCGR_PEP_ID=MMETSP1081-20130531/3246_1 /TAXON_ID=36882 /ORGANISM="Pyramimonas amylifera, Strain CCMP720" /LENGTH=154 /DNA_ID=CAMNT_0041891001 /DNA_START=115 /DNA_END=579 /DNA_ORIENTATION=+
MAASLKLNSILVLTSVNIQVSARSQIASFPVRANVKELKSSKQVVRAAAEEDKELPNLAEGIRSRSDFTGLGYTGEDSAGQSNIFAVEPKLYVAEEGDASNEESNGANAVAAAIGGLVLVVGLFLVSQLGGAEVDDGYAVGESLSSIVERMTVS